MELIEITQALRDKCLYVTTSAGLTWRVLDVRGEHGRILFRPIFTGQYLDAEPFGITWDSFYRKEKK